MDRRPKRKIHPNRISDNHLWQLFRIIVDNFLCALSRPVSASFFWFNILLVIFGWMSRADRQWCRHQVYMFRWLCVLNLSILAFIRQFEYALACLPSVDRSFVTTIMRDEWDELWLALCQIWWRRQRMRMAADVYVITVDSQLQSIKTFDRRELIYFFFCLFPFHGFYAQFYDFDNLFDSSLGVDDNLNDDVTDIKLDAVTWPISWFCNVPEKLKRQSGCVFIRNSRKVFVDSIVGL